MSSEDTEILEEFILETREHLSEIEPDLLEMEKLGEGVSPEIINRIFRAIHSTKGGASFLSFEALKNFSHVMENVLMQIRDGQTAATPKVVDVLLRSVDVLRAMIDDVQASDQVSCEKETAMLNAVLEGRAPVLAEEKASAKSAVEVSANESSGRAQKETVAKLSETEVLAEISDGQLKEALSGGMRLYFILLKVGVDLMDKARGLEDVVSEVASIGRCLWTESVPSFQDPDTTLRILIATVLTPDMANVALGIDAGAFTRVDAAVVKQRLGNGDAETVARPTAVSLPAGAPLESLERTATPSAPAAENPAGFGGGGPPQKSGSDVLRVKVDLLTKLMNMAGELVLGRNQLLRALENKAEDIPGLMSILQHVDRVTTELQEGIMQTRMQPIGVLFSRYQRVVRDMARSLGKEIVLVAEGADVELDKSIIELLSDPLTHIVRNSVDHGLEPPLDRERSGKSRCGRITLTAFHEGGQVNIIISDDGRGINLPRVLAKAVEKGVVDQSEAHRLGHREIMNLVMAPGFSTAEKVTDISGRGVGMDVVRNNIEKLGGSIELESIDGGGTTVMLRLPLTLAIIPSLIVGVQNARFAVPQVAIVELVLVRAEDVAKRIELIGDAPTLRLRGKLLPLVRLADLLGIERIYTDPDTGENKKDRREHIEDVRAVVASTKNVRPLKRSVKKFTDRQSADSDYNILVLRAGANQFGVIVDELFDIEEIVVKPLSSYLKETRCFAGTTILGDGRVIMILDTGGIADLADLKFSDIERENQRKKLAESKSNTTTRSVILFNNADNEIFAVSQDKVLRLERIYRKDIERMGNQLFIKYRGAGLPIIKLDDHIPIAPLSEITEELFLIIPKYAADGGAAGSRARGGIMVSKIIDAMDVEVLLQKPFFDGPGVEGAALVQDKFTLFLDPVKLLDTTGVADGVVS